MDIEEFAANPQKMIENIIDEIVPANDPNYRERIKKIFGYQKSSEDNSIELAKYLKNFLENTLPQIQEEYPIFFCDPKFERWVTQIPNLLLHANIKSILENKEFTDEEKIQCIDIIKNQILDQIFANPFLKKTGYMDEILSYIDRQYLKLKLPTVKKMYYWEYSLEKLNKLYDLLLNEKIIEENNSFVKSFSNEIVLPKHQTIWNIEQTSLFTLLYFIFKEKLIFNNEQLGTISFSLFKFKDKRKTINTTKSSFNKFAGRAKMSYFIKKHKKILKIISSLELY